jgi:histidinol-phosphate aminotransferase
MAHRFASLLRPELADLAPYAPPAGDFEVRLDANESPAFLSTDARARIARALASADDFERYPDARMTALKRAIARRTEVTPEQVFAGNGSDEVIALLLTALARPRQGAPAPTIVTTSPTFVMYRLSGRGRGFKVVEVPLDARWDVDVTAMKRALDFARPNVVFLATPNNPTSTSLSRDRLEAVIEAASDALVIIDEAYVDFSATSHLDLLRHPNVGVLRTLSKVGFAALRVGWLLAPAELVHELEKVRQPFSMPSSSQRAATLVLSELEREVAAAVRQTIAARDTLAARLIELGFDVPASDANFLWVGCKRPASEVSAALAAKSILVRSFHASGGRLATRLRVTVGLPHENERLLDELSRCG